MECPRCAYHNQADTVQCPQCHDTFQVTELEEIGHLQYTQDRLDRWWADGTLPSRVAQRLLSLAAADEDFLLERINLRNALPQPATIGATAPLVPSRTANVSAATLATGSPAASISVPAPSISEVIEHERERRRCSVAVAPQVSMALGGPAPAGATVPLGLRPAPNPRAALALPVAPPPPPKPARAPRPTFSWKQVGIYLLSERTLNALLGLGAFLILAAACVISTVNPTGLGPLPHLGAMICTTLVFYGAGAFVQQRLKLMRTGAALLAIGAAFIPLDVWTLGRDILELEPRPIWVLASVLCLPIYLASHLWLRDRAFALLTAVTGASLVVSLAHPLGIAPIWGGCALVGLSGVYLLLAHRLRRDWEQLCWALFWTAQVAVPVVMAALLGLRFSPQALPGFLPNSWFSTLGATPGAFIDYDVGTAWWLGAAFYALGARLFSRRTYAFAAAWTLPCAYLFTLTKAPFEAAWYGLCLAALGAGYLAFGRLVQRLLTGVARPSLTQLLTQPAYQVGLVLGVLAGMWPMSATGRFSSPSEASTLWLSVGCYAAAGIAFRHIAFRYAAAYLIPVALLATPDHPIAWLPNLPSLGIAALAACYLLFGRFALSITRLGDRRASYLALGREPIFQVAGLLTLAAALWPALTLQTTFITAAAISTLAALALIYGSAAFLLGQRAWAYLAVYLLPVTYGLTLAKLDLSLGATLLGWSLLALALLLAAETAARRTAEGGRSLAETVIGRGTWRSRFASPLFSACYAVSALAVALGLNQAGNLSAISAQGVAGLLLICALYAGSSAARRTSLFLYAATWLFLLPFSTIAAHAYAHVGIALTIPLEARLLALLSLGYLALAFLVDRARGHYAKPVYLAAYLLAALGIALAIPDTSITVQALGMGLLGLVWSAWLVHRGRHPSYAWVVGQMAADAPAQVIEIAEMLFQYLAVWLFPVWLVLLQSLRHAPPSPADYGMCLALLAPLYVAVSLRFARIHAAYRLPWLLGGYALSVLGPLVALPDPRLRIVALTISIALYVASALHSRRHEWLWLAAALGPALLLEVLYRFGDPARFYGIALVCLSLAYGFLGLIIQHGGIRDLIAPLRTRPLPFALPFIATGQLLCLAGLALVFALQNLGLVLIGFSLGALYYGCTAAISRRGVCGIPLAMTLAVVYVSGMQFSPLPSRWYGAGLLPGLTAFLAIGEIFRRTADAAAVVAERRRGSLYNTWAMPFNAILHLGALASFILSALAGGDQTLAWWAISGLYFALTALRRRPGPLYPAIGLALASYLGTGSLLAQHPSFADTLFSLVPPVWLLFSLAYALGRLLPGFGATTLRPLRWSGPAGAQPWAMPFLFWGVTTLAFSMLASGSDALIKSTAADLGTALAYLALLGILSLLWRSRPLVWATIAIVAMSCQEALELAGVPQTNQPACWVVAALAACLLGKGLGRLAGSRAHLWAAPLTQVAYAGSLLALCVAAGNLTLGRFALQPLAVTLAVISIILLIQGIAGRKPALCYLGIGLLNGGYVCELLFRQIAQPQAFALPLGLTLLLAAYLEWRRGAADARALLEIAAIVVLLGTTLVQGCGGLGAGGDRYSYDTFLLLESVALFGLSAVLHWKRTFFAACGALVADVFILMADPLRTVNTWYLIASIGCAMIGLVIFLEQRRQQIPFWIDDVRLRLEAWD